LADVDENPNVKLGELENKPIWKNEIKIDKQFLKELINLPKIGEHIAHEIIRIYPTKEILKTAMPNIPFKDSIKNVLINHLKGGE
jgi:hypothetical protein